MLCGGLPRDGISLIAGLPGSGKTILAQQCVFANASSERPALYLSTVSEPLEKILRYGQALTFFDPVRVGKSVYYEDLGNVMDAPCRCRQVQLGQPLPEPGPGRIQLRRALITTIHGDQGGGRGVTVLTGLSQLSRTPWTPGQMRAVHGADRGRFVEKPPQDSVSNMSHPRLNSFRKAISARRNIVPTPLADTPNASAISA
ncbi:MAG: hypothetical protein JO287_17575 [Pseudonocardiales bacterium]|nr:hypothetical protein [Pseudonocardiales bacterium]